MQKLRKKDVDKDQFMSTDSDGEEITLSTHSNHSNRHAAVIKRT